MREERNRRVWIGADGGTTVVLAHGWTELLSYWTYVTNALIAKGHRVVAYDLRCAAALLNTGVGDLIAQRLLLPVPALAQAVNQTVATPDLARLIVLPDTGHMAPLERASEVSRAIAELAARSQDAGVGTLTAGA
jgi:pimeloyl-ACP methyl ester carboxylesterase